MENQHKEIPEETLPDESTARKEKAPLRDADRYIRHIVFVALVGIVYIWNAHLAEKQLRKEARLNKEIHEKRAEYKTMQARLSGGTRKSVLAARLDTLGLRELRTPPQQLVLKSE